MKSLIRDMYDRIDRKIDAIVEEYGLTIYVISCILFVLGIVITIYASLQK
jgi:hypothetical protein